MHLCQRPVDHTDYMLKQVDVGSLQGIEHTYSTLKESLLRHRHSPWYEGAGGG